MSEAVLVFLLALLTAVATGLGALPFLFSPQTAECVEGEFLEVRLDRVLESMPVEECR